MDTNNPMPDGTEAPWPAPVSPQVAAEARQRRRNRVLVIGSIVLGALVGGGAIIEAVENSRDSGRLMSLSEVVCQELNEGKSPEFAYSIAKDLASERPLVYGEDESIAARAAVTRAQAQGCG